MNLKKEIKKIYNQSYYLLFKDDTWKGWVFSIIFIFIFIKFIFFPTLSLITGTQIPLAIVESCSMYHKGDLLSNYDDWWKEHEQKYLEFDITKKEFQEYHFTNGFNKGDILFITGAKPEKLEVGDIIIFNGNGRPIIHRIIKIKEKDGEYTFSTIGDNNNGQLTIEKDIKSEQLIGKATFKIAPLLGWTKLIFYEAQRNPQERGFCDEN